MENDVYRSRVRSEYCTMVPTCAGSPARTLTVELLVHLALENESWVPGEPFQNHPEFLIESLSRAPPAAAEAYELYQHFARLPSKLVFKVQGDRSGSDGCCLRFQSPVLRFGKWILRFQGYATEVIEMMDL